MPGEKKKKIHINKQVDRRELIRRLMRSVQSFFETFFFGPRISGLEQYSEEHFANKKSFKALVTQMAFLSNYFSLNKTCITQETKGNMK